MAARSGPSVESMQQASAAVSASRRDPASLMAANSLSQVVMSLPTAQAGLLVSVAARMLWVLRSLSRVERW